jgi:DNA-binding NtrC family response regulator
MVTVSNQRGLGAGNRPEERNASDPPRATIVVLDDDVHFRLGAARALRNEGYDVFEAVDVAALYDILARAPVDLVLADSRLTDGNDGWVEAQTLAERYPRTRVLLMSGYSAAEIREDGGFADATFVEKGGSVSAILIAVEEALAR